MKLGKKSFNEGVSPIIAVLLMIAILIVLAATIYVLTQGPISEGTNYRLTLRQTDSEIPYQVEYEVKAVAGGPRWDDLKIEVNGDTIWNGEDTEEGWTITIEGGNISNPVSEAEKVAVGQRMRIRSTTATVNLQSEITFKDRRADRNSLVWREIVYP